MTGFVLNIEKVTLKNEHFRHVLHTEQHTQVVVMSLKPNEDIGVEIHEIVDQFIRVEVGVGKVIMNGEEHVIKDGDAFVIPAGTKHNVLNTSSNKPLKLYSIYSPPHHKDRTVHKTKQDATRDKDDHL